MVSLIVRYQKSGYKTDTQETPGAVVAWCVPVFVTTVREYGGLAG